MFIHLHLHTEYSLLDGAIRLKDLFPKAREYGYGAVAITDHGNMYGALNFYLAAKKHGIHPIIGCEVYVAPGSRFDRSAKRIRDAANHLVLLAKDNQGYQNLVKLVSIAHLEGFFYKPRVDIEVLKEYNEGLIALSACLKGDVSQAILNKGISEGKKMAETYAAIFPDRFYLEIQENGIQEQDEVNKAIIDIAKTSGIPIVATNDCHYLDSQDSKAHDVLLCIQTNKTVDDTNRMRFSTDKLYFASPEEMEQRFKYIPEALAITEEIANSCHVDFTLGKHHFPVYPLNKGETYDELFKKAAWRGFEERVKELGLTDEEYNIYKERLEFEISVICQKGFPSYFLIVSDFINWAKSQGIPVGPGRGSAAGSLVAYSMRITEIDPVKYGLFFERFLNVERESLPDIDVDFCMKRRDEVLGYVANRYGADYCAQIITFGQLKARAVIRDVGRALAFSYPEVDKIAKLIPEQLKITLDDALKQEPRLAELVSKDKRIGNLITIAKALEGLPRHTSTHAAGVVISDKPMAEYLPLTKGQHDETVTQFDMKCVEKIGLIKFDFLGLKTLTVIDVAIKLIKELHGIQIDTSKIPLDDPDTYKLLSSGDTTGVFQLESPGMKDLLRRMKPSSFTDMIALVALYRPGPLDSGMVEQFVDAKHGKIKVEYLVPELEPILKETYGVIVYQEQVMKIAQSLAGYSLGEGDLLRRAMGKKKPEEMAAQRERFLKGAQKNNIPGDKAKTIFDLMEKFAGYGFNKSHSAAYAYISYHTAWLKTHYFVPFMASLLTNELGNTDGVMKFMKECQAHNVEILPPDINKSGPDFTVDQDKIRFGLNAVKNVGAGAVKSIVKQRNKDGPFNSFMDFCTRVNLRKVNKRVIESLIKCGAFDSLGHKRSQLLEILDNALDIAQLKKRDLSVGQMSLFSVMSDEEGASNPEEIEIPNIEEWPKLELLTHEKEALGFFISGHPLDQYKKDLKNMSACTCETLMSLKDNTDVHFAGTVRTKKEIKTKKGDRMAFVVMEDLTGSIEVIFFPDTFAKARDILSGDKPIWIHGTYKREGEKGEGKIECYEAMLLDDALKTHLSKLMVDIKADKIENGSLQRLAGILKNYRGDVPVTLNIKVPKTGAVHIDLPDTWHVSYRQELCKNIDKSLGYTAASFRYKEIRQIERPSKTFFKKRLQAS